MRNQVFHIVARELRRNPYLIGFVVFLAALFLWAIIVPLPKRPIKRVIVKAKKAFVARDAGGLRPLLAEKFDSPLAGGREEAMERAREIFKDVLSLSIKIKRIRIHVEGDKATAWVQFYISGTIRGGDEYPQLPFRGLQGEETLAKPLERCLVRFVKEADNHWRIAGVELLGPAADTSKGFE